MSTPRSLREEILTDLTHWKSEYVRLRDMINDYLPGITEFHRYSIRTANSHLGKPTADQVISYMANLLWARHCFEYERERFRVCALRNFDASKHRDIDTGEAMQLRFHYDEVDAKLATSRYNIWCLATDGLHDTRKRLYKSAFDSLVYTMAEFISLRAEREFQNDEFCWLAAC